MGSPCEIQLYATDQQQAQNIADHVIGDVIRLENRYSRYKTDSVLSEINRHAANGKSIEVDPETASLLNYAVTCYEQSDGLFDITSGVLRKAWKFNLDIPTLANPKYIEKALKNIGWDKVKWANSKLSFPRAGMELDFGGIVKEYATDRAAVIAKQLGVDHGLINLGGDIKVIGSHPDGNAWQVGIQHPNKEDDIISAIGLIGGGMATSGDYQRYITIDGKRYGHILNPKTGWPVQYFSSVTVVSEFCVLAGSASTIAMLKEAEGANWLNSLNLAHQWIDQEGNVGGTIAPLK
ncbi:MAG: FAD:protein FMN transferase [Methylococcales bacterium]|nr:FAD:protein FMN transferase [Methylococcales bacterium]